MFDTPPNSVVLHLSYNKLMTNKSNCHLQATYWLLQCAKKIDTLTCVLTFPFYEI